MNTTIRTRRTWLFLLPILVLCALTLLMSAQARGGSKIEDGWEYYPVTKTFEYQEQHPIGVRDAVITYKDNVIVGEQPQTFKYQDLEITGYGETIGEYRRLKLKDSYKLTCLYDWTQRITGYGHGVIRTYWDQVLVPEERELFYWDWTPAGTTTHYAVVADQKQTFDPASFSYTTWEQSADGKWQHVQKEQSYQVSRWYVSEKELPYTVQEWEKTLKKVTYQVHRVEKVKKEVIGTWPILETYKIYLGQTKYVLENEYVRYSFETARIGTVWKTVDYATTVLGTEDRELHYGVEEIGTDDKQFDYEVMERRCLTCEEMFPLPGLGAFTGALDTVANVFSGSEGTDRLNDMLNDILFDWSASRTTDGSAPVELPWGTVWEGQNLLQKEGDGASTGVHPDSEGILPESLPVGSQVGTYSGNAESTERLAGGGFLTWEGPVARSGISGSTVLGDSPSAPEVSGSREGRLSSGSSTHHKGGAIKSWWDWLWSCVKTSMLIGFVVGFVGALILLFKAGGLTLVMMALWLCFQIVFFIFSTLPWILWGLAAFLEFMGSLIDAIIRFLARLFGFSYDDYVGRLLDYLACKLKRAGDELSEYANQMYKRVWDYLSRRRSYATP